MKSSSIRRLALLMLSGFLADFAQDTAAQDAVSQGPQPIRPASEIKFKHDKFTFARIRYTDIRARGRLGSWATDYPDSDQNFSARFQTVTGLPTDPTGRVVKLTDPELKTFPFVYLVEGGGAKAWVEPDTGRVLRQEVTVPILGRLILLDEPYDAEALKHAMESCK